MLCDGLREDDTVLLTLCMLKCNTVKRFLTDLASLKHNIRHMKLIYFLKQGEKREWVKRALLSCENGS